MVTKRRTTRKRRTAVKASAKNVVQVRLLANPGKGGGASTAAASSSAGGGGGAYPVYIPAPQTQQQPQPPARPPPQPPSVDLKSAIAELQAGIAKRDSELRSGVSQEFGNIRSEFQTMAGGLREDIGHLQRGIAALESYSRTVDERYAKDVEDLKRVLTNTRNETEQAIRNLVKETGAIGQEVINMEQRRVKDNSDLAQTIIGNREGLNFLGGAVQYLNKEAEEAFKRAGFDRAVLNDKVNALIGETGALGQAVMDVDARTAQVTRDVAEAVMEAQEKTGQVLDAAMQVVDGRTRASDARTEQLAKATDAAFQEVGRQLNSLHGGQENLRRRATMSEAQWVFSGVGQARHGPGDGQAGGVLAPPADQSQPIAPYGSSTSGF